MLVPRARRGPRRDRRPSSRERHLDQITLFRRFAADAIAVGKVTCMLLTEIDHVAIAVNDLEAAIEYYRTAFGSRSSTARSSSATASRRRC